MHMFERRYGSNAKMRVTILKAGVTDEAASADWTPAVGDVTVSKDGGAAANITTLPIAIVMGHGAVWEFQLSTAESQAAEIVINICDAATKAVQDTAISISTFGHPLSGQAFRDSLFSDTAVASANNSIQLPETCDIDPTDMVCTVFSAAALENVAVQGFDPETLIVTFVRDLSNTPIDPVTFAFYPLGLTAATDYATAQNASDELAALNTLANAVADVQGDVDNIQTNQLPPALTADGNLMVDALRIGGVTQTGRDLGAGVLVADKTGFSLSPAANIAVFSAPLASLTANGSIGLFLATQLDATMSSRATPAEVYNSCLQVIDDDEYNEPPQETPPSTATLAYKINYCFKFLINPKLQNPNEMQVFNSDGSRVDHKQAVTVDDVAQVATRGRFFSGP